MFTHYPSEKVLARGVGRARGTILAVLSHSSPSVEGWASAVGAHNILTGEQTPPVDRESARLFANLIDASYRGYYDPKDSYIMAKVRPALSGLVRQGHDADFIVSYGLAYGLSVECASGLRKMLRR